MCGICGIYNFGNREKVDLDIIQKMNRSMVHRGPDDEGYFVETNFGFGMRRLSIIDPSGGHQPIHNEDKTVWTICNGEIYNFKKLQNELIKKGHNFYTKSDTEIIVHLYEEYGDEFIDMLRGMFGLAVWDSKNKKLVIARDHIGIKPLYYYLDDNQIIFGSEIKAILNYKKKSKINFEALNHYLSFLYIPTPFSIYNDIFKLEPGHYMIITEEKIETKKYWEIKYNLNYGITEDEAIEELDYQIKESVRSHLISDVPLGAFLSGGLDSSIVVYYMSKILDEPVKTFSIGFKEKSFDETPEAKIVADFLKTDHTSLIVKPDLKDIFKDLINFYDEPFADYSSIPFYFVSKLAKEKVKVVLTGDGGDELFGGYQTYFAPDVKNMYLKIPKLVRDKLIKPIINSLPTSYNRITFDFMAKRFISGAELPVDEAHLWWKIIFNLQEKLKLFKDEFAKDILKFDTIFMIKKLFEQHKEADLKNKLMFIDYSTFLFDDILPKSDRMSMANSLEVRVPLCDRNFIEFSSTIPGDLKTRKNKTKYLFRKLAKKYLPEKISKLRKKGFSPPIALWLYNELRDYTKEVLSEENIKKINLFNYDYVEKIVNEHLEKKNDNNRKLWALIIFVIWWFEYYEK